MVRKSPILIMLLLLSPILTYGSLIGADIAINVGSPQLTYNDIFSAADEEKKELGITQPVHVFLSQKDEAYATLVDGEYTIVLGAKFATRASLRHELLHIANGHVDKAAHGSGAAHYLLRYEMPALFYGITGFAL